MVEALEEEKDMPTIGSWYKRLEHMAQENA